MVQPSVAPGSRSWRARCCRTEGWAAAWERSSTAFLCTISTHPLFSWLHGFLWIFLLILILPVARTMQKYGGNEGGLWSCFVYLPLLNPNMPPTGDLRSPCCLLLPIPQNLSGLNYELWQSIYFPKSLGCQWIQVLNKSVHMLMNEDHLHLHIPSPQVNRFNSDSEKRTAPPY